MSGSERKPESRMHLRGFASLSPERRKEISVSGGKAAHRLGVAHQWDEREAREAARKGVRRRQEIRDAQKRERGR